MFKIIKTFHILKLSTKITTTQHTKLGMNLTIKSIRNIKIKLQSQSIEFLYTMKHCTSNMVARNIIWTKNINRFYKIIKMSTIIT